MLNVLIVDDEELARKRLRALLEDEPDCRVAGEAENGLDAVRALEETPPDLVFLDVQMPGLDGFGVIQAVGPERMPPTLFVTAYDQYALAAFDAHALDYLLKPFTRERFHQALDRARTWVRTRRPPALGPLADQVGRERPADRMLVKDGERYVFVRFPAIQWVEAEGNYVRIHVEGTSHVVRQTLADLLERLPAGRFRRIHRSAIVNLDAVQDLEPWTSGDFRVRMKDGTRLTLSRTFRAQFADWL